MENPLPRTLRQLYWMAAEKKRFAGELTAWLLAGIVRHMPLTGRVLNPSEINPYKGVRRESPDLARIKAFIAARGLAAMAGRGRDDDD